MTCPDKNPLFPRPVSITGTTRLPDEHDNYSWLKQPLENSPHHVIFLLLLHFRELTLILAECVWKFDVQHSLCKYWLSDLYASRFRFHWLAYHLLGVGVDFRCPCCGNSCVAMILNFHPALLVSPLIHLSCTYFSLAICLPCLILFSSPSSLSSFPVVSPTLNFHV